MSYQQARPPRHRIRTTTSAAQPLFDWSKPAYIAANQQRTITPEQRAMLKKQLNLLPAGCMGTITFLTFVPILLLASYLHHSEILFLYIITFGLALLALIFPYMKRAGLLSAADQGFITQEQGEITWQNSKYVARTPTRQLITAGDFNLPPPGPYHFYYLADSAILLSADPIKTNTGMVGYPGMLSASGLSGNQQVHLALQQALCSALNFSMYDLDCNRRHALSGEQRRRLFQKLFLSIIGSLISIPIGIAILVYAASLHAASSLPADPITIFLFIFGGGIILTALYRLTFSARARYQAIQRADLTILSGFVQPRMVGGGSDDPDYYYYDIGSTSIRVTQSAYDALTPNTRYDLYYFPSMQTVLSIEPLEAPPR
jgi:hypothetical protein